jgi:response regulator RpfG family c-di-GMP phosphodiesterase
MDALARLRETDSVAGYSGMVRQSDHNTIRNVPRVLCVDDDPHVLAILQRVLLGRFDVQAVSNPFDAIGIVEQTEAPFAVIISDLSMPGMDGIALLRRAREATPNSMRVLLTGNADMECAVEAVNEGSVFRFLVKPCAPDVLITAVAAAVEQYRLVESERVLLEQTLRGSVKALTEVLAVASPSAFARAMRLKRYVGQIADALDVADRWEVEVAALISQLGCVSLPSDLILKMHVGGELDASEQAMVDALPATAASFVAELPRLDAVRNILTHQNTPYAAPYSASFDGPGPNLGARVGAMIPLGARMLKAASDLDWLLAGGMSETSALSSLAAREGVYDPEVLNALSRAVGCMPEANAWRVRLRDVREGMIFFADVRGPQGLLLAAAGQEVGPALINRLRYVWNNALLDAEVSVCYRS